MVFLNRIFQLYVEFFDSNFFDKYLIFILPLAFLVTVPYIFRFIFRR